ncbi:LysE family translocator [Desulfovibrio sp. ZJ200]|uniref:LysE family translocator n=1 Tax=Desulfovibrio sp. ZJ200 TaxID=2709792 RepID=UPI0013EA19DC|nr:LysE family translocator [Desulfovibrio sp. ZJ200]
MPSAEVILVFFGTSLLLGIAPGPDNIFVLTQSAVYGVRAGLITTLGLVTGLCVHTTAVALGVAAIFQSSALAFTLLKAVGAAYLLYLAWLSFRAGALSARTPDAGGAGGPAFPGYAALYRRGILMNVTNPKVSLFFLAFLPQFCDPARGSLVVQVLILGALFMLATIVVFFSVAVLGGRLAFWLNRSPRSQMLVHRAAGLVFTGLAVMLIFTGR